jgi:hypothetical protein
MVKLNIWKHENIALGLRAKLLPDFLLHLRVLIRHISVLHLKNNSVPCYLYGIAVFLVLL